MKVGTNEVQPEIDDLTYPALYKVVSDGTILIVTQEEIDGEDRRGFKNLYALQLFSCFNR